MQTRVAAVWAVASLLVASCATAPAQQQQQTIEPTSAGGSESAAGSTPSEDQAFVLSRARKAPAPRAESLDLHFSERWWKFRADHLRIDEGMAKVRDQEISEAQAPERFWDQQTATEAISVWTAVCNECHGGRRKFEDALKMPVPAADWGRGEGLFFGARRRYADVFAIIYRGGPERRGVRSEMPAWRGKLAKELIWALLYFLEYQSGGIEGRFPPSLYPRRESID